MTTPRTRLDEATNDFERDLLRSYEREQPSTNARARALGAITGGALLATTTTAGAGTALAMKIGFGAVLALFVAGGIFVASRPTPPPPAPAPAVVIPPPVVIPPTVAVTNVAPVDVPPEPPKLAPPRKRVAAIAAPEVKAPEPKSPPEELKAPEPPKANARALGEQVALIDKARTTLDGGDAAGALRILDDYDTRFADGSLSQEATVLRIDALLRQGRRQEATDLGDRFVAARPKSPYAAKIRRLLDTARIP